MFFCKTNTGLCLKIYRDQDDKELSISVENYKLKQVYNYEMCLTTRQQLIIFENKESSKVLGSCYPNDSEIAEIISRFLKGEDVCNSMN
jgi:hypothetical protein